MYAGYNHLQFHQLKILAFYCQEEKVYPCIMVPGFFFCIIRRDYGGN